MLPVLVTCDPYSKRVDAGSRFACHSVVPTVLRGPHTNAAVGANGIPSRQALKIGPNTALGLVGSVIVCSTVLAVDGWFVCVQSMVRVAVSASTGVHWSLARAICSFCPPCVSNVSVPELCIAPTGSDTYGVVDG